MAQHGIEMILMRRLAAQLTMPIMLVDPRGDPVFFNAGAASVFGRRFEDTGAIGGGEWSALLRPSHADGSPMKREEEPRFVATERRQPSRGRMLVRGFDGVERDLEGITFPLIGQGERMLGAVSMFWNPGAPPRPGVPRVGPLDLASPGADRPVELLLMRQLASYLATIITLLGPDGTTLFYNEPAERLLGRRFEETEEMSTEEWAALLPATDDAGEPIPFQERPVIIALQRQQPAHRRFWIGGFDQVRHEIEGIAFPLVDNGGSMLGAVGIFWEHAGS
ncbi:MAG: PAS domain-containing protein [Myxococcales bacterium]|nr:MAG: PAS domain-containing protein [Myxococcales bacterium]